MAMISETFSAALHHYQAGNIPLAEALFQQVLDVDPNHTDSLHFLGLIGFARGHNSAASELIRQAISLRPNDVLLHCNLGNVLSAQGKLDDAVTCYRHALALEPDHAAARYNLAGALDALGQTDEAIACYQRALQLRPGLYQAYHNLGQAYQAQYQLEKAVGSYRQALELKPDLAETHLCLGNVLLVQRKFGEAVACYRRALELQPDCAQAHANLAVVFRAQGNLDGAIASCRRALALKPDYFVAHNNLGDAFLAQGELQPAIESYRSAVEVDPTFNGVRGVPVNRLQQLARLDDALGRYAQPLAANGSYRHAIRFVSTGEEPSKASVGSQFGVRGEEERGEEEHDCQLVSSYGILKSCDVRPFNHETVRSFRNGEYSPDWSERLQAGQSVYVCTSAMADFVANVFPRLPSSCPPFVLVTGDADELAPVDIFPSSAAADEFLNSPRVIAWFAQNCIGQHPKLFPLPIGLDYHTIAIGRVPWWGPRQSPVRQEEDLLGLRASAAAVQLSHRAYANFHFNMTKRFGRDRRAAMAQIPAHCVYYEARKTPRLDSWRRQRLQHRFVLSPLGNGLDCHRTWEALCLGCIPIVRSSPLDKLWEGLPVWIINSWSDVTEDSMAQKAAELDNSIDIPDKLLLKTWVEKIRRAGIAAR
ncbi:MAG TPA: tetratricopeptide repeat protein [Pirellulaceae bacterium]|jgi:tetratricopeptide (TPR) repeat protein